MIRRFWTFSHRCCAAKRSDTLASINFGAAGEPKPSCQYRAETDLLACQIAFCARFDKTRSRSRRSGASWMMPDRPIHQVKNRQFENVVLLWPPGVQGGDAQKHGFCITASRGHSAIAGYSCEHRTC
jgi:hypothetical protein